MLEPNTIRHNRLRCDHGWDIDLDDGSSWYRIYDNLLLNGGLKMREGYDRVATNNIIINNGLHPHVWYPNSGDVFAHNIVFKSYSPALMNKGIAADGKWGKTLDSNFYVARTEVMHRFLTNGCDSNSLAGDAGFINPSTGNYGLVAGARAFQTGFKPFSMEGFGVSKPSLRAIAKTPAFPDVQTIAAAEGMIYGRRFASWGNAKLWVPRGEEYSAFGLDFSSTGVALEGINPGEMMHAVGFRNGDLIQSVGNVPIPNIQALKQYINTNGKKSNHIFVITRNQKRMELTVDAILPEIVE